MYHEKKGDANLADAVAGPTTTGGNHSADDPEHADERIARSRLRKDTRDNRRQNRGYRYTVSVAGGLMTSALFFPSTGSMSRS
jgi:hypothetical protein